MNKGLHRYLLCLTGATFLLLMAGALVTSHDAGLATSDWPLSNGQVFPRMVGNLFWEHGHRMVATTIGLLTTGLVVYLYALDVFLVEMTRRITSLFFRARRVEKRARKSAVEAAR